MKQKGFIVMCHNGIGWELLANPSEKQIDAIISAMSAVMEDPGNYCAHAQADGKEIMVLELTKGPGGFPG